MQSLPEIIYVKHTLPPPRRLNDEPLTDSLSLGMASSSIAAKCKTRSLNWDDEECDPGDWLLLIIEP